MAQLKIRVGDKGGGKTGGGATDCLRIHQYDPRIPVIVNTPVWWDPVTADQKVAARMGEDIKVPGAVLHRESLRWLACKVILKDTRYTYMMTDEPAIAEDLESRGSSGYSTAPRTYLIALSRKVTTDIDLITQMISMVDKRAQWLADVPLMCRNVKKPDNETPDYFVYEIYDAGLNNIINAFEMDGDWFIKNVVPRYDTSDVPLDDNKIQAFANFFGITSADLKAFELDMLGKKVTVQAPKGSEPVEIAIQRMLKKGDQLLYKEVHYVVLARPEWDETNKKWVHLAAPRVTEEQIVEEEPSEADLKKAKKELLKIQKGDADTINAKVKEAIKDIDVTQEDRQAFNKSMEKPKT